MKNSKKVLPLFLSASMFLVTIGCGTQDNSQATQTQTPQTPAETAAAAPEQVTVVDQCGREVTLGPVNSIACGWYMANDFPLALGVGDRVVAMHPDEFQTTVCPSLKNADSIGRGKIDLEKMAELNPDLMIHKAYDMETIQACADMGFHVIGISSETSEETMETMRLVGKAVGKEDRANMLCDYYQSIMDVVEDKLSGVDPQDYPTFLYLGKKDGSVADDSMMQAQMVNAGGGRNLASGMDATEFWPVVGNEQIFEWDPDFIFLSSSYSSGDDLEITDMMNDPAWSELQAVKNGRVYVMPSALHSWENCGLAPCLGTTWSMMKMYPDLYREDDFDELVREFYQIVYDLDVTREMLGY